MPNRTSISCERSRESLRRGYEVRPAAFDDTNSSDSKRTRRSTCPGCFDELDRYVELELAGKDADAVIPGLRAHLDGCPACREEHASLLAFVGGEQAP
jgi:hypothetical protein